MVNVFERTREYESAACLPDSLPRRRLTHPPFREALYRARDVLQEPF